MGDPLMKYVAARRLYEVPSYGPDYPILDSHEREFRKMMKIQTRSGK